MRNDRALEAVDVVVRYGDLVAVRGFSATLPAGGSMAVLGPAGAGKTSLLWALAGATAYDGSVRLGGAPVEGRAAAAAAGVALVPQGNGLAAALTAEENVQVALVALGVAPPEAAQRTGDALARVGLEDHAGHLVEELSGGQQQRLAVARALAQRPAVLLADEPTSDLDAATRTRVLTALLEEASDGAVVVMATHDQEAAALLGARVVLDEGTPRWEASEPVPAPKS